MGVDGKRDFFEGRKAAALGRRLAIALPASRRIEERRQLPSGRDPGIEQTQRARGGVPRVREQRLPGLLASLVERREGLLREIDLAPHLEQGGNLHFRRNLPHRVSGAQRERHGMDRPDVRGDVLARRAVAARRGAREATTLVDEGHGEAVDLQLTHECRRAAIETLGHAFDPGRELLRRVSVLERKERNLVPHVRQLAHGRAPDSLRG